MSRKTNHKYGINSSLIERIQNAIDLGLKTQIRKLVPDLHPADQADLIYSLNSEQREEFIDILQDNLEPEVLVELEGSVRSEIISYLDKHKLAEILSKIDTDDAVDIIEDLKGDLTKGTLKAIKSVKKREEIEEALSYPEDSVGRLMLPKQYVAIPKDWIVGDVIKYMRRNQKLPKEFADIVVVDEYYRPVSTVSVGQILQSEKTNTIAQLMEDPEDMKILRAEMDQSEAALLFTKYNLKLAPVVNDNGVLSGVISLIDMIDVINEEAEEDMLLMGNVKNDDVHLGFFKAAWGRFPWLVTTVLSTAVGSSVINAFSGTIEKVVALAVLMPVISGLGGVAGTQTLTVLVRNLATQEINKRNALKIIFKEVFMGLLNGLFLASMGGLAVYFWNGSLHLSLIFGATIMFILIISGFIGSTVPLIVTKLKLDPAVTSGAFITTTIDILSFLLFLKLATMFVLR